MKRIRLLYIAFLVISISCNPEIEVTQVNNHGAADFTRYIAIGNSLTAGFADNGLYPEAQMTSYPNLLSEKMKLAGGGEFKQPLMPGNGSGYLLLINTPTGPGLGERPRNTNAFDKVQGPFNNLGIPGIRAKDVIDENYGKSNRYFGRILPEGQDLKTYVQLVTESSPTFFTCWIGSNDVLGYAFTGGKYGTEGEPGTGENGITSYDEFVAAYTALMDVLGNAKGIVITVPDILLAPLFTTMPKTLIPLNNEPAVNHLNQFYADYNQGVDAYNAVPEHTPKLNKIEFKIGSNFPIVEDKSIPDASGLPKISQLTHEGYLLLTLPIDRVFSEGWGSMVPIPDEYSLTATEVKNIRETTQEYNQFIRGHESANIGIFESTAILQKVAMGMIINGAPISSEYLTGGVFSLDGAHLTPRGNALLANEIINVINNKFHSTLQPFQVTFYPGVSFP
jgi:hypothetical protein